MTQPKTLKELQKSLQILDLQDTLPFGRYKDCKVFAVMDENPSYLVWLHDNTSCKVRDKIYTLACKLAEDRAYRRRDGWIWDEYWDWEEQPW